MTHSWPFSTHNIYIPENCTAKQIESLSKSRLLHAEVFVGPQHPYLYIGPYQHPNISVKAFEHTPKSKWLAMPQSYDLACLLNEDIANHEFLLIHSGKGQLYWRCKSRDFIDHCLSIGAKWQNESLCDFRTGSH